jgi:P-type Cu+ transporter
MALLPVSELQSVTGKGVTGVVGGHKVAAGNSRLMDTASIDLTSITPETERLRSEGQTVMFVAIDRKPAGPVGVADPIKASTKEAINLLHQSSIRITMLTKDSRRTAEAVCAEYRNR